MSSLRSLGTLSSDVLVHRCAVNNVKDGSERLDSPLATCLAAIIHVKLTNAIPEHGLGRSEPFRP